MSHDSDGDTSSVSSSEASPANSSPLDTNLDKSKVRTIAG